MTTGWVNGKKESCWIRRLQFPVECLSVKELPDTATGTCIQDSGQGRKHLGPGLAIDSLETVTGSRPLSDLASSVK